MSDLYRLVYYSRNRTGGSTDDRAKVIGNILAASRRNNPPVGVTGALMFNRGCFGQVLEGARDAVAHTFERIQQDDRHGDVALLAFAPAAKRSFEAWSMAFVGASVEDAARYGTVAGETGYDPSRVTAEQLFDTLRGLVMDEEATV